MRSILPALLLLASCTEAQPTPKAALIPLPATMIEGKGYFPLTSEVAILLSVKELKPEAEYLRDVLATVLPYAPMMLPQLTVEGPAIALSMGDDKSMGAEGYRLSVTPERIELVGVDRAGVFHGIQTLLQLLPPKGSEAAIPCVTIADHPRFGWRGMHLDVCRHFFPVEFVKTYIDLLARYKMNRFHWHLTDDQGWRIEIKKFPKLTEVGAWRSGSQVGPYSRREYDSTRYGGFYTQDQIREVVEYAAARHITVVPEIEMPGHAMAALASYPALGCTGGPYEVQKGWGVFDDVFCTGNDSVFTVLEGVLTEVMELFPGEYIHIGGDECPKERWKTCPKCQGRMKAEGLKDEHELQSYFIQRIEKFVNAKGKKIIGWDEILEGGLAPNAAVMSWRGTEGGVAAAKLKHNVVMSPGSHCYFDHYQGDPANEPLAIGGYTTVQKVYSYEPIPEELKPEQAKYILGAQGNVWTEYILTPEHVEYMAVPRMLALAEVLWTPKEKRDEKDFIRRLEAEFPRLEAMKVNVSRSLYQVTIRPTQGSSSGEVRVTLNCPSGGTVEYGIMDGMDRELAEWVLDEREETPYPTDQKYSAPFSVSKNCTVLAQVRSENGTPGLASFEEFHFNKATAQKITLSDPPNERYNEGGAFTLVDGITAQEKRVNTEWLGWKQGVTITVDLGSEQEFSFVGIGALNETYSWIHLPERVDFSLSTDGKTFTPLGTRKAKPVVGRNSFGVEQAGKARYVRITVVHPGKIPDGFPGAGNPSWLFLDEIDVH
ncbi:MAG: family 20 glycosylhydrolase [Flavobacteriales bacterium]|nr:family 20 glycosylhydrolase [Flavobacteriales bacterium]